MDKKLARDGWIKVKNAISQNSCNLVILDELTYPINYGMIEIKDVIETIVNKPQDMTIIITGRDAPQKIIEIADTVSEINSVKHHYDNGIKAQKGIEF